MTIKKNKCLTCEQKQDGSIIYITCFECFNVFKNFIQPERSKREDNINHPCPKEGHTLECINS